MNCYKQPEQAWGEQSFAQEETTTTAIREVIEPRRRENCVAEPWVTDGK
jgi:hypothetical protein